MCLRDETSDDLKPRGSGENGSARLEFADLDLHLIGFRFADVGRVGDHEVKGIVFEPSKQIGLMKLDSRFKLKAGGVGAADFKRRGRDVDGMDLGLRQLF